MADIKILSKLLANCADVLDAIHDAKADGKITKMEAWGIAFKAPQFFPLFSQFDALKIELADLDEAERTEITRYIATIFHLPATTAARKWEACFELLTAFGVAYRKFTGASATA